MKVAFLVLVTFFSMTLCSSDNEIHYNIPDPECSGPFGLCTQEDKDRLGYLAIKKLHEIMDDDRDGHVEIQETQEFMAEELQLKNGAAQEKEKKFHGSDTDISVEEMWKTWQYSEVYNWTTDQVCVWIGEQVKLPQYAEYFKRNRIDGQFLPRLAVNDHNYYAIVMQIKDPKHRRLIMIKSTDLVLFGQSHKSYSLVKDVLMVGSLTVSILVCIYLYSKHRQSLEQIKQMINEFEKLTEMDLNTSRQLINPNLSHVIDSPGMVKRRSTNDLLGFNFLVRSQQKENKIMSEKNSKLSMELTVAKREAEQLKRERESADGQLKQLELAIKELEKVRAALRQAEARLDMSKFQAPPHLLAMLNRAFESEKDLFDYKQKAIEKEKNLCYNELNKLSKRQSGVFGAFKLVHSSYIEELNHRIDLIKHDSEKLKAQRAESLRRWNTIWTSMDEASAKIETKFADYSSNNLLHECASSNSLVDHQRPAQVSAESASALPKSPTSMFSISSSTFKTSQSKPTLNLFNSTHSIHKDISKIDNIIPTTPIDNELTSKILVEETPEPQLVVSSSKLNLPETSEPQPPPQQATTVIGNTQQPIQFKIANGPGAILATTTIITPTSLNGGQKIARDSIIHKADVFQFDDVDSVHTHDSLYVPRSDEDDQPGIDDITYSSSEVDRALNSKIQQKKSSSKQNKKHKDSNKKSKILSNLINPLIRNNSNKNTANSTVKPAQESSLSVKFQEETTKPAEKLEVISMEKSKSISKHLNSLKRLLTTSSPSNSANTDISKNGTKLTESTSVNLIRSMSDVISPSGESPTIAPEPASNEGQDDIKALKKRKFPTIKLNRRKSASKLQSTTTLSPTIATNNHNGSEKI